MAAAIKFKTTNSRLGGSLFGYKALWQVQDHYNNKNPSYKWTWGKTCHFWANGYCKHGLNCKYLHAHVVDDQLTSVKCESSKTDGKLVNYSVYVQNIPPHVTENELMEEAKSFGELYAYDKKTGRACKIQDPSKSTKADGTLCAWIHFTKVKAGKNFENFINMSTKWGKLCARMNNCDEHAYFPLDSQGFKPIIQLSPRSSSALSISSTSSSPNLTKRIKKHSVIDEDGWTTPGRRGTPYVMIDAVSDTSSMQGDEKTSNLVEEPTAKLPFQSESVTLFRSLTEYRKPVFMDDTRSNSKKSDKSEQEKRRDVDGVWYTKQEFYDYYSSSGKAEKHWHMAIRDTIADKNVSWIDALCPDLKEKHKEEIDCWGEDLELMYLNSSTFETTAVINDEDHENIADKKDEENEKKQYSGYVQEYEEDDNDEVEIDFADEQVFAKHYIITRYYTEL